MAIELRGSMFIYLVLVVTSSFTPFWRNTIIVLLLANSIWDGDILGEIPFYTGALLADISLLLSSSESSPTSTPQWNGPLSRFVKNYWAITLGLFGGFLASYPPNNPEMAAWSRFLRRIGPSILNSSCIFPPSFPILTSTGNPDEHYRWAYTQIGAVILIFAIHFSPLLRRIYSIRPAVFFGSISFAVYLTHSFLMRSVLVWVVHGVLPQSSEEVGWLIWVFLRTLAYVSWIALVIFISTVWRDKIDKLAMIVAQRSEEVVLGHRSAFDTVSGIRYKLFRGFKHDQGNGSLETPISREKAQV